MSSYSDSLVADIGEILNTKWDIRDGNIVPESEDITLKDGAVRIEGAFLYADLAGSAMLARKCPWGTTAKIIRAYLSVCTRLIRIHDGHIRSFDGDRVMGVFKEGAKVNNAVDCALEIDWMVYKILNPKAQAFPSVKDNGINIRHCIGIDSGNAVAVRAGIRNNNDIIWIGRPPSLAAKLSDIREFPHDIFISNSCHSALLDRNKLIKIDGTSSWEKRSYVYSGEQIVVYRTASSREP